LLLFSCLLSWLLLVNRLFEGLAVVDPPEEGIKVALANEPISVNVHLVDKREDLWHLRFLVYFGLDELCEELETDLIVAARVRCLLGLHQFRYEGLRSQVILLEEDSKSQPEGLQGVGGLSVLEL